MLIVQKSSDLLKYLVTKIVQLQPNSNKFSECNKLGIFKDIYEWPSLN